MNRAERRKMGYLNHPAYLWAIDSNWPQKDAKLLAFCVNYGLNSTLLEAKMGERLTFTKFNNVRVLIVTDKAIQVLLKPDAVPIWVARSNIRSDDDRRMGEVRHQLESHSSINTVIHIADWLVRKEGWQP